MRHVAFWMPDPEGPGIQLPLDAQSILSIENNFSEARTAWVKEVELYLLSLYDLLCDRAVWGNFKHPTITNMLNPGLINPEAGEVPSSSEPEDNILLLYHMAPRDRRKGRDKNSWRRIEGKTRHEMVRISGVWDSMPIEITAELHSEYVSLSICIELAQHEGQAALFDPAYPHYRGAAQALDRLNDILTERARLVRASIPHSGDVLSGRKGSDREALKAVHQALYSDIWSALRHDIIEAPITRGVDRSNLGLVFTDFRGILLRHGSVASYLDLRNPKSDPDKPRAPTLKEVVGSSFGDGELTVHADVLFPLLLANPDLSPTPDGEPAYETLEHTFTGLQDCRTLYASSLISQSPDQGNRSITPLTYLVFANHGERWQLGRLINRLHTMGTLRLAAIRGLHQFSSASGKLRSIELALDDIDTNLARTLVEIDGWMTLERTVNALSQRIGEATKDIPGKIGHRTERSKYYLEQLEYLMRNMRVHRVESFQTYPQLVHRRMGASFDSIRLTGARYVRIQDRMRRIQVRIEAAKGNALQSKLTLIQQYGEVFLCLFILPYYIYSFWSELVDLWIVVVDQGSEGQVRAAADSRWYKVRLWALAFVVGLGFWQRERLVDWLGHLPHECIVEWLGKNGSVWQAVKRFCFNTEALFGRWASGFYAHTTGAIRGVLAIVRDLLFKRRK